MKVLLDVIKTLLLINGAIVLPLFFIVMALYKQQSTNLAAADTVASDFHRDIQDETLKFKQDLDELKVEKNQLQAKLEASEGAKIVPPLMPNGSSVSKAPTQITPVSQPQPSTTSSKPSVKTPVLAKLTTVSQTKPQPKPYQPSVLRTRISTPRKTEVPVVREQKQPKPIPKFNVAATTSTMDELSPSDKSSDKELGKTPPKDFVTPKDLNKTNASHKQVAYSSIVPPQAKTPIEERISLANDLSVGLVVAGNKGEVSHNSNTYDQVQTAMRSLRKGSSKTLEEAAKRAGIDLQILKWLAEYGQNRPGNLISMIPRE
ncbi:MAG: hypothetical protein QNJ33_16445 [Crocosphaera sp.]|nr:hypothetical protein [Crocosphaera sp.]